MRVTYTCMLCIEKDLPLAILGQVSGQLCLVWAVPDCCSLFHLLDMWLSASFWCMAATSLLVTLYDITFCICCFHGVVCKLQSLGKCHVCYVVLWLSACLHVVVELFCSTTDFLLKVRWPLLCILHEFPVCVVCMCVCVRVPCASACLCICVRGKRGGEGWYVSVCYRSLMPTYSTSRACSSCLPSGLGWVGNGKKTEIIHIKISLWAVLKNLYWRCPVVKVRN